MGFKVFTAGSVLTAADVNDYLMEQAVIACTSGTRPSAPNEGMVIYQTDTDTFAVYNGTSWLETTPESLSVQTSENTTSTTYADLSTSGPAVTLTTGTKALVTVSFQASNTNAGNLCGMGWAVSGATTLAAADTYAAFVTAPVANYVMGTSRTVLYTSLTAGANTFTAKYRTGANTASFLRRDISVLPIP